MKTVSLLRALINEGIQVKAKPDGMAGKFFTATKGKLEISWHDAGDGEAGSIVIRDTTHVHNPWEDSCSYVWFPKTIRDAVKSLIEAKGAA